MVFSDEHISALLRSSLFEGLEYDELKRFVESVGAAYQQCRTGVQLVRQGERRSDIQILLSGAAVGERVEPDGRAVTVNEFSAGDVFGDILSGTEEKSPVTVRMTEDGEIVTLPFSSLVGCVDCDPSAKEKLLRNLISQIAGKYLSLQRRMDILLCTGLRAKICAYLLGEREKRGADVFIVPHTREEQSRLLNCDRSALSRELSRMKRDGLVDYSDRRFELLDPKAMGAV